jgi:hypothetical protein
VVDSSGGIVADPARLRQIAGAVDAVVGILDGTYTPRQANLVPVAGPWAAATAAGSAAQGWGTFVGRLRDSVRGVADGMRAAVDGYSVTDANAARLIAKAR